MLINGQTIDCDVLCYDEYYYKKQDLGKELNDFELKISWNHFQEKLAQKYEILLQELIEDDKIVGENYAQELFSSHITYPSFDDLFLYNQIEMKEKIEFLDAFFMSQILNEYVGYPENKQWIIRKVSAMKVENNQVIIQGDAQII